MDTNYLKDTVGDALTRGCAATATVRPGDPVEYLANWLHKYVFRSNPIQLSTPLAVFVSVSMLASALRFRFRCILN